MSKVENKMFPFNLRRPTLEVLWAKSWRSWEDWSQLIHFLCWFWTLVGTPNKNNTWFSQQPICRPFFITKTSPKRKPITGWGLPTRHEKKQDSKLANKKSTESTWFYLEESFILRFFPQIFLDFLSGSALQDQRIEWFATLKSSQLQVHLGLVFSTIFTEIFTRDFLHFKGLDFHPSSCYFVWVEDEIWEWSM